MIQVNESLSINNTTEPIVEKYVRVAIFGHENVASYFR